MVSEINISQMCFRNHFLKSVWCPKKGLTELPDSFNAIHNKKLLLIEPKLTMDGDSTIHNKELGEGGPGEQTF